MKAALRKLPVPVTIGVVVLHLHEIFDMLAREEMPDGRS